jgi:hypothetical protein
MAMEKFRSSPLPNPPGQYSQEYVRQLIRVVELYFGQLDSQTPLQAEYFKGRGDELVVPTALYFSTQDQTAAVVNTAYDITFNNVYYQNELTLTNSKEIYATRTGIYNFQFSGQLKSGSSNAKTAQIWINRDGTDIGFSAHAYTDDINNGYVKADWNFNIDVNAGSYIKLRWATDDTGLGFESEAASAPYPGIPSAVMAVNFVSSTRGITVATPP